jgi:hypothetical protein
VHLNFRQGLISFQQSGALPQYLSASSTVGYIDINVTPTPLIATIAHGSSDYLLKFDASVHAAWGPIVSGTDSYLYLELNVITGALTYGITTHEPVISMVEPASPFAGQMWFDLNPGVTVFKARNADNTKWVPSPRLVLAVVLNGNVNQIQMYTAGTSGALNVPGRPGFLMLDSQLRPLRTSTGELLTQDTGVRLKTTVGTSGVLSAPVNSYVPVRANEPIPAMSLVYLSGTDSVSLASSNPALMIPKNPIGIIENSLALNETGVITQAGELMYDQWDWSADIGKPLYCGFNGELTTTRPQSVQAYRVGYVKSPKTILFYVDSETTPQVVAVAGSIISGVPPIVATTGNNLLGEIVTSISMHAADATHDGYMTFTQANLLDGFDARLIIDETAITNLQAIKANTIHTHVIADVTGLQTDLNTLTTAVSSKTNKVVPTANGNFAALDLSGNLIDSLYQPSAFALAAHVHLISEVTGLQTILNLKSDVGHTHAISDVINLQSSLDNKAFVNHTHSITNVTGLQLALDGKALLIHTHVISDVIGLQAALDLKSNVGHTHIISDVTGLQTALNLKSDIGHAHIIADVTGLQAILDGKSNVGHTHVAANITDFSEAVDDRVAALLIAGTNISITYNDPANTLTISNTALPVYLITDGYAVAGTHQVGWATNSVAFGTDFVSTFAGTGQQIDPGSVVLSAKKLTFYEGATVRATYPNAVAGDVQTSVVFGSGLTATVSGTNSEVLTVTAPSVHTLDGLDDVVITAPTATQVLTYNGTTWVNAAAPAGGGGGTNLIPSTNFSF